MNELGALRGQIARQLRSASGYRLALLRQASACLLWGRLEQAVKLARNAGLEV